MFGSKKRKEKQKEKEKPMKIVPKSKRVTAGITFGGGGTRGFAHLGVIKAFEENGIDFDVVSGTSVGSLIGSLYANGLTFNQMYEIAKNIKESDIRNSKIIFVPSKSSNIEALLKTVIKDSVFSDLKKPFGLSTVDIISGQEVVIDTGLVARAVSASCAVPAVFTPVEWRNFRLVDGGLLNPIPSDVARKLGADVVVSVDINSTRGYGTDSTSLLGTLMATLRIAMKSSAKKGIENSDIVIQPKLREYNQTKLEGMDEMIEEGYNATMSLIEPIKELLNRKK